MQLAGWRPWRAACTRLRCTYNWCWPHHELSRRAAANQGVRGEVPLTPAMASGLTDHIWVRLLAYRGVAREGHT